MTTSSTKMMQAFQWHSPFHPLTDRWSEICNIYAAEPQNRRVFHVDLTPGSTLLSPAIAQVPRIHHHRGSDTGHGHWCKRRSFQCDERADPASAECAPGQDPLLRRELG